VGWAEADSLLPQLKAGNIRMLGITDQEDNKFFPGVKTFGALGYKIQYGASRGIVVRSDTPRDALDVLGAAVKGYGRPRGEEDDERDGFDDTLHG
jgi:tripartite-type tricarboxylate transporter receptor subunit TctC